MKAEDPRNATTEELFARLLLERGLVARADEREAEGTVDDAVRAELARRPDAIAVAAAATRELAATPGPDALAQHRHAIACGIAAAVMLERATPEAGEAFLALASHAREQALASIHRAMRGRLANDQAMAMLLDRRCESVTLRLALGELAARDDGAAVDERFGERLRALVDVPGIDVALDALLAGGGAASREALLRRALADPRRGAPAVSAMLARFDASWLADLRTVLESAGDPWSIVEQLIDELTEEGGLDAAYARGEGATWWTSPEALADRVASWLGPGGSAPGIAPTANGFEVRGVGTTGLAPMYRGSLGKALRYEDAGGLRRASLRPALAQDFVVGGASRYMIHCWRWHRDGEYNRVHRRGANANATATATIADGPFDAAWLARSEQALAALCAGPYRVFRIAIGTREVDDAPFSRLQGWPDEREIDLPESVKHFVAEPWDGAHGPTELVLLPSGLAGDAPPVAYAWRAPEELALAMHKLGPPPPRTRLWAVLLQGEDRLREAAEGGGPVTLLVPDAWAGEVDRIAAALAPRAL